MAGQESYTAYPEVLRPKSRGTVRLSSSHYDAPPLVDPNYLSHPDDLRLLIKGNDVNSYLNVGSVRVNVSDP